MTIKQPSQFTLDILVSPQPTLENFVVAKNHAQHGIELIEVLKRQTTLWQTSGHHDPELEIIYIWGPTGSGKSHLLKALHHQAQQNDINALFLQAGSSLWSYLEYGNVFVHRVYFIDNVDQLNPNEQSSFFRLLIEAKENEEILIIATGSESIHGLSLRTDISSRLASGLNFQLHILQDNEKIVAINEFSLARGLHIPKDIAPWLIQHFHRDLPSLLSLIEALDHYSLQSKRAITLPLVRDLLKTTS